MTDHTPHRNNSKARKTDKAGGGGRQPAPPADRHDTYDDDEFERGMLGPEDFVGDPRYVTNNERLESEGDARSALPIGKVRSDVGYRRPPAEFQFQRGVSGNPRGRKPTPVPFGLGQALVEGGRKIERVRRGNETVELTRQEILAESLWTESINGKVKDKVKLVELLQRCGAYRVDDEIDRIRQAEEDRQEREWSTDEYDREVQRLLDEIDTMPDEQTVFQDAAGKCTCPAFDHYRASFPIPPDDSNLGGDANPARQSSTATRI